MDRFIGCAAGDIIFRFFYLKSNMDRFIEIIKYIPPRINYI